MINNTIINKDILKECLGELKSIPISEDDLKFQLAHILHDKLDAKVFQIILEYPVSKIIGTSLKQKGYSYIDIVIHDKKEDVYFPIELKYKTKKQSMSLRVFNDEEVFEFKNQGAQNLGKYYFWADVKRLYQVLLKYKNVKRAFQIFLTNDFSYKNEAKKDKLQYKDFSVHHGRTIPKGEFMLQWKDENGLPIDIGKEGNTVYSKKTFYNKLGFEFNGTYFNSKTIEWCELELESKSLIYTLVDLKKVN
jgi:hypothetical protein